MDKLRELRRYTRSVVKDLDAANAALEGERATSRAKDAEIADLRAALAASRESVDALCQDARVGENRELYQTLVAERRRRVDAARDNVRLRRLADVAQHVKGVDVRRRRDLHGPALSKPLRARRHSSAALEQAAGPSLREYLTVLHDDDASDFEDDADDAVDAWVTPLRRNDSWDLLRRADGADDDASRAEAWTIEILDQIHGADDPAYADDVSSWMLRQSSDEAPGGATPAAPWRAPPAASDARLPGPPPRPNGPPPRWRGGLAKAAAQQVQQVFSDQLSVLGLGDTPQTARRRPEARQVAAPLAHLDAATVARRVASLGPAFSALAPKLASLACDGAFLVSLSAGDLDETLSDVGFDRAQRRRAKFELGLDRPTPDV